jgi:hypothetical protein
MTLVAGVMDPLTLIDLSQRYNSIFFNAHSTECARLSAGSLLALVEEVVAGRVANGLAVIRYNAFYFEQTPFRTDLSPSPIEF